MGTLLTKTWPTGSCSETPAGAASIDYGQAPNPEHYQLVLVPQWVLAHMHLQVIYLKAVYLVYSATIKDMPVNLPFDNNFRGAVMVLNNSAKHKDSDTCDHNVSLSDSAKTQSMGAAAKRCRTRKTTPRRHLT